MNTQNEVERIVRGWLEERVAEPRPTGLDSVLERVPATPQRRRRWLDRVTRRVRGAIRTAHDRRSRSHDGLRRRGLMLTTSGLVTSIVVVALAATLVIPADRGGWQLLPGAGTGATRVVAQDGDGDFATIGEPSMTTRSARRQPLTDLPGSRSTTLAPGHGSSLGVSRDGSSRPFAVERATIPRVVGARFLDR